MLQEAVTFETIRTNAAWELKALPVDDRHPPTNYYRADMTAEALHKPTGTKLFLVYSFNGELRSISSNIAPKYDCPLDLKSEAERLYGDYFKKQISAYHERKASKIGQEKKRERELIVAELVRVLEEKLGHRDSADQTDKTRFQSCVEVFLSQEKLLRAYFE